MSDDLIAFLRARLDEAEAGAHASGPARVGWATYRDADGGMFYTSPVAELGEGWSKTTDPQEREWVTGGQETHPTSVHVVYDPADVLADVDAKRGILDEAGRYSPELEHGDNGEWAFDIVLRLLALPYSDHPDYREEWRP